MRLSTKIAGLSELSINRQDPNFITSEVDSVAASVQTSEQAMSELDFLTGFGREDEPTPDLLDDPLETTEDKRARTARRAASPRGRGGSRRSTRAAGRCSSSTGT